jgi:hypothetical protein
MSLPTTVVMAVLVTAIHVFRFAATSWMRATSPRMTSLSGARHPLSGGSELR